MTARQLARRRTGDQISAECPPEVLEARNCYYAGAARNITHMKGGLRTLFTSLLSRSRLFLACLATLASAADLRADGCFVLPLFVWNRFKDINEPTQKAILLYDAGREDMILR